jgi:hypothetical protein
VSGDEVSGDIVWRLRVLGDCLCTNGCHVVGHPAADEIERLRAHNLALSETSIGELFDENKRLRAAGDALADAADPWDVGADTIGAWREARREQ